MSEQVNELSSIQSSETEKIKVSSAEIVVHGTEDKPYYEIEYFDLSDHQYHTGYSSYNLDFVFRWREECFDIVKVNWNGAISEQVKELRESERRVKNGEYVPILKMAERLGQAADTIESLSTKLQVANEELERWHTDHINEKIKNPFAYTSTLICHNCDHKDEYIEELEAEVEELKAANMERSSEDCGGWISCKERLPKVQDDDVLLCVKDEDGEYQIQVGYYRGREGNKGELMFNNCIYDWIQGEVIAWQPLPEPYHEP